MNILQICKKEYRQIFKQKGVIVIFFAASLLYPIVYGFIYKNEVLRDIPVAVVDMSASAASRQYIRMLNDTPELQVAFKCNSQEEAKTLFQQRKVYAIFVIPVDFEANINGGKANKIPCYFSMGSFLYYKSAMTAASMVTRYFGTGITQYNLAQRGIEGKEASVAMMPIKSQGVALFNSGNGFSSFLLPAVFVLIIYQTLMMGIGILRGHANEKGIIPQHNILIEVTGRALCYFSLYAILTFYVLFLVPLIFNLPHIGNEFVLVLFIALYLLATIFFAMTISAFFRSQERAFLYLLFLTLPLLFMSGISWPQSNIPAFWKTLSLLFPSTAGIQGYVRINTMQAGIADISKEIMILGVQIAVYFATACWAYGKISNRYMNYNKPQLK